MGQTELRNDGVLRSSLRASNAKQHQRYAVCGMCQDARSSTVSPKSGQKLRTARRRTWAPGDAGSQWCNRLSSMSLRCKEEGVLIGVRISPHT